MISPSDAEAAIARHCAAVGDEACDVARSIGRVLRVPLRADRDSPAYDRVMMDGYALRVGDASIGGEQRYRVCGTAAAGHPSPGIGAIDEAIEVMTGAVLPEGSDSVVPIEWCRREGDNVVVAPPAGALPLRNGLYVHPRGSEGRAGRLVIEAGLVMGPAEAAVAATEGVRTVRTGRTLHLRLVTTGDEVVPPESQPLAWQIRGSHAAALSALFSLFGPVDWAHAHASDRRGDLRATLASALEDADLLLVAGGVSRGRFDLVPDVLASLDVRPVFHRVAQRPGKPLWFGTRGDVPVFGLPGNPVAVIVCARRYVVQATALRSGAQPREPMAVSVRGAAQALPGLTHFLPVSVGADGVVPMPTANSADLHALVGSDGFVEIPPSDPVEPDGRDASLPIPFYPWSRR